MAHKTTWTTVGTLTVEGKNEIPPFAHLGKPESRLLKKFLTRYEKRYLEFLEIGKCLDLRPEEVEALAPEAAELGNMDFFHYLVGKHCFLFITKFLASDWPFPKRDCVLYLLSLKIATPDKIISDDRFFRFFPEVYWYLHQAEDPTEVAKSINDFVTFGAHHKSETDARHMTEYQALRSFDPEYDWQTAATEDYLDLFLKGLGETGEFYFGTLPQKAFKFFELPKRDKLLYLKSEHLRLTPKQQILVAELCQAYPIVIKTVFENLPTQESQIDLVYFIPILTERLKDGNSPPEITRKIIETVTREIQTTLFDDHMLIFYDMLPYHHPELFREYMKYISTPVLDSICDSDITPDLPLIPEVILLIGNHREGLPEPLLYKLLEANQISEAQMDEGINLAVEKEIRDEIGTKGKKSLTKEKMLKIEKKTRKNIDQSIAEYVGTTEGRGINRQIYLYLVRKGVLSEIESYAEEFLLYSRIKDGFIPDTKDMEQLMYSIPLSALCLLAKRYGKDFELDGRPLLEWVADLGFNKRVFRKPKFEKYLELKEEVDRIALEQPWKNFPVDDDGIAGDSSEDTDS